MIKRVMNPFTRSYEYYFHFDLWFIYGFISKGTCWFRLYNRKGWHIKNLNIEPMIFSERQNIEKYRLVGKYLIKKLKP